MKTTFLCSILCCFLALNANAQNAQLPEWGPAKVTNALFYYLPALNLYYDVQLKEYVYQKKGKIKKSKSLPAHIAEQDLYNVYKVIINMPKPYLNIESDKVRYAAFMVKRGQQTIRDYEILERMNNLQLDDATTVATTNK